MYRIILYHYMNVRWVLGNRIPLPIPCLTSPQTTCLSFILYRSKYVVTYFEWRSPQSMRSKPLPLPAWLVTAVSSSVYINTSSSPPSSMQFGPIQLFLFLFCFIQKGSRKQITSRGIKLNMIHMLVQLILKHYYTGINCCRGNR